MTDRAEQVRVALAEMGDTHSLDDIVDMINSGTMQSFVEGDTWVITQIIDFPRKRVLEVFLVVGDMSSALEIYNRVFAFAREEGCVLVRAFGRDGWQKWAAPRGWRNGQRIYYREA